MILIDCLRDQEVPTHFSKDQERVNLCKDLTTFGPFKGIRGASTLQDPGCARGLGAGIDLNYGNSSSSSKMNSESDGDGSNQDRLQSNEEDRFANDGRFEMRDETTRKVPLISEYYDQAVGEKFHHS